MRSETYLTKDIERMRERIAKEVPEAGEFKTIEEVIVCPDTVTNISRLWLEVSGAPRGVEDYQHRRALKIVAERIDSDNAVLEIMFAQGTKEHILSELGKEEIILKLTRLTQKLAYC